MCHHAAGRSPRLAEKLVPHAPDRRRVQLRTVDNLSALLVRPADSVPRDVHPADRIADHQVEVHRLADLLREVPLAFAETGDWLKRQLDELMVRGI